MDEFATKFADFLDERIVKPVRSITDDKVDRMLVLVALGLVAAMLLLLAAIFSTVAIFRLLSIYVTATAAYTILGGLFMVIGAFVWSKRFPKPETKDPTNA